MLKNLINLLFPNLCCGCNALLLENEGLICAKRRPACAQQGAPFRLERRHDALFPGRG